MKIKKTTDILLSFSGSTLNKWTASYQKIKGLKRHGGTAVLSQDETALDRLITTTPHLA